MLARVDAGELGRGAPAATSRSSAGRLGRRGRDDDARRRHESIRLRHRRRSRARSPSRCARIARTVTPVRTSKRRDAASAIGSRPSPPASEANTGPAPRPRGRRRARPRRRATSEPPCAAAAAASAGIVARSDSCVGPPGVDAAEQRLDQPVGDLVAQPRAHQRSDGDVVARAGRSGGARSARLRSGRARAAVSAPDARTAARSAGMPSIVRAGSGCSAARRPEPGRRVVNGAISSIAEPSSRDEPETFGPAGQHRLGAHVDRDTRDRASRSLPPTWRRGLEHRDRAGLAAGERPRGGEPGDAAADDARRGATPGPLTASGRARRSASARPGSVSGGTPWPRLKMWPVRRRVPA